MTASTSPAGRALVTVLAQIVGATAVGVAGGAVGYGLVSPALGGAGLGMGLLTLQIYGVILGFGAGAGAGAALVGQWLGRPGSLWLAILGGVTGGVLVGIVHRLQILRVDFFFLPLYAAVMAVGGALAGNRIRRR